MFTDDISDDEFASEGEEEQPAGAATGDDLMGGEDSDGGESEEEEEVIEAVGREAIGACIDDMELSSLQEFCDVACVIVDRAMGAEAEGHEATEGAVLSCLVRGYEAGCASQPGSLRREEANKASKHLQAKLAELRRRPKREAASKKRQRRKEKGKGKGKQAAAGGGGAPASSGAGASAPAPAPAAGLEAEGEGWEDELEEGTAGGVAAGGEEWEDELEGGAGGDEFADEGDDDGDGFADDDDDDFADEDEEEGEGAAAGGGGEGGAASGAGAGGEGTLTKEEEEAARKTAEEEAALESKLAQMTAKDRKKRARIIKKFGEEPKDPRALRDWQANVKKYEEGLIARAAMGLDDSDSDSEEEEEGAGGDPEDDDTAAKMVGDIDEEGKGEEKAVTDRQKAEVMPLGTKQDYSDALDILCGKALALRKEGGRSAPLRDALRDLLMAATSQGCENKEGCLSLEQCQSLGKAVDRLINDMIKAFNKKHVKKGSKGAKFAGKGKRGMGVRMGDSLADRIADGY